MAQYCLTRKPLRRSRVGAPLVVIPVGVPFDPTAQELKAFGDMMVPYTPPSAVAPAVVEEEEKESPPEEQHEEPPKPSTPTKKVAVEVGKPVPSSNGPSLFQRVYDMSVNSVLKAVQEDRLNASQVIEVELEGRKRKTLISALEELVKGTDKKDED